MGYFKNLKSQSCALVLAIALPAHSAPVASVSATSYSPAEYAQMRVLQAHSYESKPVNVGGKQLSPTEKGLATVYKVARLNGVDPGLMLNIARVESGGDCNARGGNARGVLQVVPKTAGKHGVKKHELFDCDRGALAGVLEMKRLLRLANGDIRKALIGYKCGQSCMNRKRVGKDTQRYVDDIMGSE